MDIDSKLIYRGYKNTELFFGLTYAVGTDYDSTVKYLTKFLEECNYKVEEIKVSSQIIKKLCNETHEFKSEYQRIKHYMDLGNELRKTSGDNSILSLGVSDLILRSRDFNNNPIPRKKTAYIINSLKHPEEIIRLREIYSNGFFLIGIYADKEIRKTRLEMQMSPQEAIELMERDEHDIVEYGQNTSKTFQMCDFFVEGSGDTARIKADISRIINLIFGYPYATPTFDEFAMFMAFASSLRSGDLSRQVGAVIAKNNEIISTGANDCPKFGGGLYWTEYSEKQKDYVDFKGGRDYTRGYDSNKKAQLDIAKSMVKFFSEDICIDSLINNSLIKNCQVDREQLAKSILEFFGSTDIIRLVGNSPLKDITEYGRVVHAEMEAILSCARNSISTVNSTLYCTTFPCHNCAKHIIDAGIISVYYIEPYPKSKAFDLHNEAISSTKSTNKVTLLPFIGVGPRKFFDLFSISLSSGYNVIRKGDNDGKIVEWTRKDAHSRFQLIPESYIGKELLAARSIKEKFKKEGVQNE